MIDFNSVKSDSSKSLILFERNLQNCHDQLLNFKTNFYKIDIDESLCTPVTKYFFLKEIESLEKQLNDLKNKMEVYFRFSIDKQDKNQSPILKLVDYSYLNQQLNVIQQSTKSIIQSNFEKLTICLNFANMKFSKQLFTNWLFTEATVFFTYNKYFELLITRKVHH